MCQGLGPMSVVVSRGRGSRGPLAGQEPCASKTQHSKTQPHPTPPHHAWCDGGWSRLGGQVERTVTRLRYG